MSRILFDRVLWTRVHYVSKNILRPTALYRITDTCVPHHFKFKNIKYKFPAGVIIIPTATFSFIIGGLIPKWLNLHIRGLLCQSLIFCVSATLLVFQFLLRCDMSKIAGITTTYDNRSVFISCFLYSCKIVIVIGKLLVIKKCLPSYVFLQYQLYIWYIICA